MAAIFLQKDAQELLKNKYIVVMGGSIQRSIYKDLIRLLQGNTFLTDSLLRMKGEDSFLKDKLLDGGMRGKDKKGIGYREVRQYHTDFYFLQFVFMTRCYNTYMESVISKFESAEQKPDVIIVNSCLWDITRYGDRPVPEYKENLQKLFKKLKSSLPECLVIWNTNPAISHSPKGGVFIPGLDYLKDSMELHVLEANYYASKVAVENGHDVVDLHYFLRHQIHRRAEDGIHWDMTGHRRITNLVLTHIAQTWGIKLPKHIKMNIDIDTYEIDLYSEKPTPNQYEMNKLEGNQRSGKSIFDVKVDESGKPENDGLLALEVPKTKPSSESNSTKRKKKVRGKQWKKKRHSHVPTDTNPYHQIFEYNHQQQGVHNFSPQNQPRNSPQFVPYNQQQTLHQTPFIQQNHGNQFQQQNFGNNIFHQQDFRNDNYMMLNFDNGQWQPYQNEEPSYGNMRHFANIEEPPRYNPYQRGRGLGRDQRGAPY